MAKFQDIQMSEPSATTRVVLQYMQELRAEVIERLKMRDAIMIAYLAGTGALLGFGVEHPATGQLREYLLILVPFLSLGAISIVTQHQDQIAAFNQYLTNELNLCLPPAERSVVMFNNSLAAKEHTMHNLWLVLIAQFLLMCGPPVVAILINGPYAFRPWTNKNWLLSANVMITALVAWRVGYSLYYRRKIMQSIFNPHPKTQTRPRGKA